MATKKKRAATTELNHENWDQEEETEEPGQFTKATNEALKKRVIKVAKRRGTAASIEPNASTAQTTPSAPLFAGFTGFAKPANTDTPPTAPKSSIRFGSQMQTNGAAFKKPELPSTNALTPQQPITSDAQTPRPSKDSFVASTPVIGDKAPGGLLNADSVRPSPITKMAEKRSTTAKQSIFSSVKVDTPLRSQTTQAKRARKELTGDEGMAFAKKLEKLNKAVVALAYQAVSELPCCELAPLFNDYLSQYDKLKQEFGVDDGESKTARIVSSLARGKTETQSFVPKYDATSALREPVMPVKPTYDFSTNSTKTTDKNTASEKASTTSSSGKPHAEPTPVFTFTAKATSAPSAPTKPISFSAPTDKPMFAFNKPSEQSADKEKEPSKTDDNSATNTPLFSKPLSTTQPFSFSSKTTGSTEASKLPTFGSTVGAAPKFPTFPATTASSTAANNDDDDKPYVPPKAETVEHNEPDALFSIKSKMFYKENSEFSERGIGMLHVKKTDTEGKVQLLLRAQNATGTILLNVMCTDKTPISRVGKNHVAIVCILNPPIAPKSKDDKVDTNKVTQVMLRVKSGDDADKLKEEIVNALKK